MHNEASEPLKPDTHTPYPQGYTNALGSGYQRVKTRKPKVFFTPANIRKNVLFIVALLLINKLGAAGNVISFLILAAMALKSVEGAIKAVSIMGLIIIASDVIVTRGAPFGLLKYILLLIAGFTILRAARNPFAQPYLVTLLLFSLIAAVLTITNGYYVEVSLLKIVSFTYGALCMLAVGSIKKEIGPEITEWAISLIFTIVLMSITLLIVGQGFGSFETMRGERFSGFRGVLSHPQTMGIMACLFAVYLTSLLIYTKIPLRRLVAITLFGLFVLLYLSEARTGLFGYVLSIGLLLFLSGLGKNSITEQRSIRKYKKQLFAFVLAGFFGLLLVETITGKISKEATSVVKKGQDMEEMSVETLYSSRAGQIQDAWETFQDNFMTGIGFGTDISIAWQSKATLLSASTEKGFLPTAILEEVGIIGTLFFVLFLFVLLGSLIARRRYVALAAIIGLLVVNLGEMMFFAFGGMAMLSWALVAMALAVRRMQIEPIYQSSVR